MQLYFEEFGSHINFALPHFLIYNSYSYNDWWNWPAWIERKHKSEQRGKATCNFLAKPHVIFKLIYNTRNLYALKAHWCAYELLTILHPCLAYSSNHVIFMMWYFNVEVKVSLCKCATRPAEQKLHPITKQLLFIVLCCK